RLEPVHGRRGRGRRGGGGGREHPPPLDLQERHGAEEGVPPLRGPDPHGRLGLLQHLPGLRLRGGKRRALRRERQTEDWRRRPRSTRGRRLVFLPMRSLLIFMFFALATACGSSSPSGDGGAGDMAATMSGGPCSIRTDCRLYSSYCVTAPCQCLALPRGSV